MSYVTRFLPDFLFVESFTPDDILYAVAGVTLVTYLVFMIAGRR